MYSSGYPKASENISSREAEAAARKEWLRDRIPTRGWAPLVVSFTVGETIRCPGHRKSEDGLWTGCGYRIGVALPGTKVVVRVCDPSIPVIPLAGIRLPPCPSCHTLCEQFVTWDTPLEPTGS